MQSIEMERIIDNSGENSLPFKLWDGKPVLQPTALFRKYRELYLILPSAYPDFNASIESVFEELQCLGLAFNYFFLESFCLTIKCHASPPQYYNYWLRIEKGFAGGQRNGSEVMMGWLAEWRTNISLLIADR